MKMKAPISEVELWGPRPCGLAASVGTQRRTQAPALLFCAWDNASVLGAGDGEGACAHLCLQRRGALRTPTPTHSPLQLCGLHLPYPVLASLPGSMMPAFSSAFPGLGGARVQVTLSA